jgi:hypothetical protein
MGTEKQLPADLVGRFLAEIRADFPNIAISNRVPGDGYTLRKWWYDPSDKPANDPVPTYLPKEAGILFIDKGVSSGYHMPRPCLPELARDGVLSVRVS